MRAFLAAVLFCAVCAQPALGSTGLGPGVHIDPGSPAAKEYRIPITSARDEGSGDNSGNPESANAPTFGVGVTSHPSPATRTAHRSSGLVQHRGHASGGQVDRHRGRHHRAAASRTTAAAQHARGVVSGQAQAQAGSTSWLPLAAGGALVLLLGCGAGLVLRRVG